MEETQYQFVTFPSHQKNRENIVTSFFFDSISTSLQKFAYSDTEPFSPRDIRVNQA